MAQTEHLPIYKAADTIALFTLSSYQYGRFIRRADHDTLVFLHVGKFVEFHGPQRILAPRALRLVRAAIARGGFAFLWRVSAAVAAQTYIARAVQAGYAVAEVSEVERLSRTCVMRQIVAVSIPAAGVTRFSTCIRSSEPILRY